jgi:hypothetical protein
VCELAIDVANDLYFVLGVFGCGGVFNDVVT